MAWRSDTSIHHPIAVDGFFWSRTIRPYNKVLEQAGFRYPIGIEVYSEFYGSSAEDVWGAEITDQLSSEFPTAQRGAATLEACLAKLQSARERKEIYLSQKVSSPE